MLPLQQVQIPGTTQTAGTGWLPPLPDFRDYTEESAEIASMSKKLGFPSDKTLGAAMRPKIDLRKWCSPIENQGGLGSCTANAAVGIVEYFQRRSKKKHIEGSRLFVYKATRNLMEVTGDTGAWLRNTMGALALCGVAPARYWPYTDQTPDFDQEPSPFVYAVADNFEALRYFCHDPLGANVPRNKVLMSVKKYLAAGVPSMFGFFGFPSFGASDVKGGIPFPCPNESAQWGHAIVAVGYDDKLEITNTACGKKTKGAFLIRNSWGVSWGDKGYGWIPYDYVTNGIALDFWSLLWMEWIDTKKFGFQGA
ncbi:MAG: cysteine protease [Proteobacteria bacterium]|nr:cysteine protease [Pseudomonadota bacterium]